MDQELRICPECEVRTADVVCPNCKHATIPLHQVNDENENLVGRVLADRYEITGLLGRGGMGTVYQAVQLAVERPVAIKVISRRLALDIKAIKRFQREARFSSKLHHPNSIRVYDFGFTDDGLMYLVMELLHGHELAKELRAGTRLPVTRALRITSQILKALHEAHGFGIIHRDLKPSNIFLQDVAGESDMVKVMDFGVAKMVEENPEENATAPSAQLTQAGIIVGTPVYMSPEQVLGKQLDHRSDLYSLGVILFQMLVGRTPFTGDSSVAIMMSHVREAPVLASVAAEDPSLKPLDEVIACLLAKKPEERPASALAVLSLLHGLDASAVPLTLPEMASLRTQDLGKLDVAKLVDAKDASSGSRQAARLEGPVPSSTMHPTATLLQTPEELGVLKPPEEVAPQPSPEPELAVSRAPPASIRWVILGIVCVTMGLVGAATWVLFNRNVQPKVVPALLPVPSVPPVAVLPNPASSAVSAPSSSGPSLVTVRLESVPTGAEVRVGGEQKGMTPLSLELTRSNRLVEVQLRKSGYQPMSFSFTPERGDTIRKQLMAEPIKEKPSNSNASHPSNAHKNDPRPVKPPGEKKPPKQPKTNDSTSKVNPASLLEENL